VLINKFYSAAFMFEFLFLGEAKVRRELKLVKDLVGTKLNNFHLFSSVHV